MNEARRWKIRPAYVVAALLGAAGGVAFCYYFSRNASAGPGMIWAGSATQYGFPWPYSTTTPGLGGAIEVLSWSALAGDILVGFVVGTMTGRFLAFYFTQPLPGAEGDRPVSEPLNNYGSEAMLYAFVYAFVLVLILLARRFG